MTRVGSQRHNKNKVEFKKALTCQYNDHQLPEDGIIRNIQIIIRIQYTALTLRRLMSYIYGAPILDVSRSHTTTQHSR